jgi:hypothetical protein
MHICERESVASMREANAKGLRGTNGLAHVNRWLWGSHGRNA